VFIGESRLKEDVDEKGVAWYKYNRQHDTNSTGVNLWSQGTGHCLGKKPTALLEKENLRFSRTGFGARLSGLGTTIAPIDSQL